MEAEEKRVGEKQVEKEIENEEDEQSSLQGSICRDRRKGIHSLRRLPQCVRELKTILSAAGE